MRKHDGLNAVPKIELLEDVGDVRLDRRFADVQLVADLAVREAASQQAKDVSFALTEFLEFLRRSRRGDADELLDHAFRDRRREERLAVGDRASLVATRRARLS